MRRDLPDAVLASAPELQIRGVSKRFGQFTALHEIDLEVQQGEFLCLLGPSGCGKTTLLRMIAGLETCEQGQIFQAGRDITRASPAQRDYGIVFQSYALFPNLSVAENIGYGLRGRKAERLQRVQELLNLIGLSHLAQKFPGQISGGQQQRVALARALASAPQLLLLDEPLSALDAQVRAHLRSEIKDLQQKLGVTTVMVTHDQEEAMAMADRIVIMQQGRIEQIGAPSTIYQSPASRFVADFIGHCNWLPAIVSASQGGHADVRNRVRIGTSELQLTQSIACTAGQAVELFIRPEDVVLGENAAKYNQVRGVLLRVELLGSVYRLSLAIPAWDGLPLEVLATHRDIAQLSQQHAANLPALGQELDVHLPPHLLRSFQSLAA